MTEESDRDPLKRAETALSAMALPEPDWDGLATRIEGSVATPPTENEALFGAPLPRTDDEGSSETEAPYESDLAVDSGMVRPAEPTALDAFGASLPPPGSNHAGPSISVAAAESDALDNDWSGVADALDENPPAVASAAPPAGSVPPPGEPGRERVSLADLARATMARRGSSENASIAKESLAVATQSRAQGAEVAQRVQAASVPPKASASVPPPAPSARAAAPVASAAAPAPSARAGGDLLKGPWIGVAIAGIGLAAAFALVLSRPDNQPVTIVQQAPVQPAAPRAEAPLPQAPVARPAEPPAAEPAPAAEAALDPTSLPKLPLEQAPRAEAKAGGAAEKAAAPKATPAPGKVAAEKIVLDEDQKAAPKTAPSAPRPDDSKLRPADSTDKMTDRPSAGAAQAAVGAVLGSARACVAGHPQPSSAQLVFGSDGQVQSVTVGGPAAGTAAAGCIEGALKKARVQPFAASSFSLGVTVRPP